METSVQVVVSSTIPVVLAVWYTDLPLINIFYLGEISIQENCLQISIYFSNKVNHFILPSLPSLYYLFERKY